MVLKDRPDEKILVTACVQKEGEKIKILATARGQHGTPKELRGAELI